MLTIRREQLATLARGHRARRCAHILARLRASYPQLCAGVPDEEGLRRVDEAMEDGKALGIERNPDLVRFAALAFLPEKVRADPRTASLLLRVLNDVTCEAEQRLDFVCIHVVGSWLR
jgi:hypothetical protein